MRQFPTSKRTPELGAIHHLVFLVIGLFTAVYFQARPKVHVGFDEPGTFESVPPNMLMMPEPPPVMLDPEDGLSWPALKAAFVTLSMQDVLEVNARKLEGGAWIDMPNGDQANQLMSKAADDYDVASLAPPTSPLEGSAGANANGQQIGDTFQYSAKQGQTQEAKAATAAKRTPVKIPIFDMDPYMKPGDGRIIYFNKSEMKDVSHEETAVFVMKHGDNLLLDGCDFPGGVIVQTSDGKASTGGYRNKVRLKGGTKIGGGDQGASVNIGLLAPGFELHHDYAGREYATQIDIEGFSAVAKMGKAHQIQMRGMVLVYDAAKQVWNTHLKTDPDATEDLPDGVEYRMVLR